MHRELRGEVFLRRRWLVFISRCNERSPAPVTWERLCNPGACCDRNGFLTSAL